MACAARRPRAAAESVYNVIVGRARDRNLPLYPYTRRLPTSFGPVSNRLVLVDGHYEAFITVFGYGSGLYLGWTMWRSRRGAHLIGRYIGDIFRSMAGQLDPVARMLRTEAGPRHARSSARGLPRGPAVAVEQTDVPDSYAFPQGLPPVETYAVSAPVPLSAPSPIQPVADPAGIQHSWAQPPNNHPGPVTETASSPPAAREVGGPGPVCHLAPAQPPAPPRRPRIRASRRPATNTSPAPPTTFAEPRHQRQRRVQSRRPPARHQICCPGSARHLADLRDLGAPSNCGCSTVPTAPCRPTCCCRTSSPDQATAIATATHLRDTLPTGLPHLTATPVLDRPILGAALEPFVPHQHGIVEVRKRLTVARSIRTDTPMPGWPRSPRWPVATPPGRASG